MEKNTQKILYQETQHFRAWWLILAVGFVAVMAWAGFIYQVILGHEFGDNPAPNWMMVVILAVFGIVFPLFWYFMALHVEVKHDEISIRFFPILTRKIWVADIKSSESRHYNPLLNYGGWGIRWAGPNNMAYNVQGNQGVQLELNNGQRVLIGSQYAEQLAAAIKEARG